VDRKITYMLGQYLRGMALTCLGMAACDTVLLQIVGWSLGTQFSLLLGALAGVAYLIPYLGMLVATVTAGLLAYLTAQHHPWLAAGLSVGIILAVNQVFDSLLMPRIVGRKVGLHPLVVILALLSGGALLGIWGMIVATPLAATVKIILAQWVPVIATVPDVPEEKQPLVLDLGGFLARTWGAVRTAGQRLEGVILPSAASPPATPPVSDRPVSDKEVSHEDSDT
jgi:predicted PurR-regulated permease PerM